MLLNFYNLPANLSVSGADKKGDAQGHLLHDI